MKVSRNQTVGPALLTNRQAWRIDGKAMRQEACKIRNNQLRGVRVFWSGCIPRPRKRSSLNKFGFGVQTVLCAALATASAAFAQQPAPTPEAPVPPAIRAASKIFLSNAGADSGLFPSPFSGDANRGYNQLYAGLKANGKYQMVSDPADADLVLELQLTAPNGPSNGSKVNGASNPVPMLRLVVYDRKTHYILWAFTQSIEIAFLQKTHDRNFDDALTAILLEFESLSGKAQAAMH
jgi:hypothetical protein